MSQTRRLAAIVAADVVGYSRLMGADEEGHPQPTEVDPCWGNQSKDC
jgi:hypothetical protein